MSLRNPVVRAIGIFVVIAVAAIVIWKAADKGGSTSNSVSTTELGTTAPAVSNTGTSGSSTPATPSQTTTAKTTTTDTTNSTPSTTTAPADTPTNINKQIENTKKYGECVRKAKTDITKVKACEKYLS